MHCSGQRLEKTKLTYECDQAIDRYEATLQGHRSHELVTLVRKYFSNLDFGLSVADFGCGTGDIVNELRAMGFNAYGYDYSEKMVKRAIENYGKFFTVRNLTLDGNFTGKKFDVLISISVLLHIPNSCFGDFIDNCCSFGKPECQFLLATKVGELRQWDRRLGENKPRLNISHSPEKIQKELDLHSFELIKSTLISTSRDAGEEVMYVGEYRRA